MNAQNGGNALQAGMSELRKITLFQIVSIAVIFIMGLIIVTSIIGSTLWLWLLLIILLAAGISLFIFLIIVPTSRVEELLRVTADENKNLVRQNYALQEQLANLQNHIPEVEQDETKLLVEDEISEDIAVELPAIDESVAVKIPVPLVCSIIQPQDGMTIRETYRVLVESAASDSIAKVEIAFDNGEYIDITNQFDGVHYYYDWEIEELESGVHTIDARVTDNSATPQTVNAKQINVTIDTVVKKLRINIKTDKETYRVDSMLRVEVKVTDNFGASVQNAVVDMTIYDSDNSIQAAGQGMTNINGVAYFGSEIMLDDPTGVYTIETRVSLEGYEPGMESTTFEVEGVK
ncbi:MAG: Ig-like domain-containing protein [Candidatus Poribacteria bacterium]